MENTQAKISRRRKGRTKTIVIVFLHAIAVPKPIISACAFRNEGKPIECRNRQNRLTMLTAKRSGNGLAMGLDTFFL